MTAVAQVGQLLAPHGWQPDGAASWRKGAGRNGAVIRFSQSGTFSGNGYLPLLIEAARVLANANLLPAPQLPPRKPAHPPRLQHKLADPLYDNDIYRRANPHCAKIRNAIIPFDGWEQETVNSWTKQDGTRSARIIRFDNGTLYGEGYLALIAEAGTILQEYKDWP